jgi:hypothetical protein
MVVGLLAVESGALVREELSMTPKLLGIVKSLIRAIMPQVLRHRLGLPLPLVLSL